MLCCVWLSFTVGARLRHIIVDPSRVGHEKRTETRAELRELPSTASGECFLTVMYLHGGSSGKYPGRLIVVDGVFDFCCMHVLQNLSVFFGCYLVFIFSFIKVWYDIPVVTGVQ